MLRQQTHPLWLALAVCVGIAACDKAPPRVVSVAPADGAIGVPLDTQVIAGLDERIQPDSVGDDTLTLTAPGGPVAGTVTYDNATGGVVFTPATPLSISTQYTATLQGVEDAAGHAFGDPYVWTFRTTTVLASP